MARDQLRQQILPLDCVNELVNNGVFVESEIIPELCEQFAPIVTETPQSQLQSTTSNPFRTTFPQTITPLLGIERVTQASGNASPRTVDTIARDTSVMTVSWLLIFVILFYIILLAYRRYHRVKASE